MVRSVLTGLVGLITTLQPALALPQRNIGASDPATCIANGKLFQSGLTYRINDENYTIRCAKDSSGDAKSVQMVSRGGFAACSGICDRTMGCAGFTYSGDIDAGNCYLKSNVGGITSTSDDVVTGYKDPKGPPGVVPRPAPSSIPGGSPPVPVPGLPSGAAPAVPKPGLPSSIPGGAPPVPQPGLPSSVPGGAPPIPQPGLPSSIPGGAPVPKPGLPSDIPGGAPLPVPGPASSSISRASSLPVPGPASSSASRAPPASTTSAASSSTNREPSAYTSTAVTTSSVATTSTSSSKSSEAQTLSPTLTPSSLSQCQEAVKTYGNVYRGGSGSPYQLSCGTDRYGGDLTREGSDSFLGCVDICDKKPECIGYAYTPGNCYLKNALNSAVANPGVDFAVNLDRNSTAASATTSSTTSTPSAAPGSCSSIAANGTDTFTNADGVLYNIECGSDHNGGDLVRLDGKTFTDCSILCDQTDKCIGYAWVGGNGPGNCYLKSTVTNREPNAGVSYAYKKAATYLPSSSASASPSTNSASPLPVPVTTSSIVAPPSTSSFSSVPIIIPSTVVPPFTYTPRLTSSETKTIPTTSAAPPPTSTPRATSTGTKSAETKSDKKSSTQTEYVSKTYTQTNYVSSTGSSKPSSPATSAQTSTLITKPATKTESSQSVPTSTHTHTHTHSHSGVHLHPHKGHATKTTAHHQAPHETSRPNNPAPVPNKALCGQLRNGKTKNIRVHIVSPGSNAADGQYIRDPSRDGKHAPLLTSLKNEAAAIAYNADTQVVAALQPERDACALAGLAMYAGNDAIKDVGGVLGAVSSAIGDVNGGFSSFFGGLGQVLFAADEASGGMVQAGDKIVWDHPRFGGWLVCNGGRRTGGSKLMFWNKGKNADHVPHRCAVAELRVE